MPVRVRIWGKPVWLRPGTSDYSAYRQVVCREGYGGIEIRRVRSIIDCGANIGLASIYFLNRFPEATVLAVEPDPENVALCQQNLEPYGGRVKVVNGAVWSHRGRVVVVPSEFGPSDKWGVQVRACESGDSEKVAVDAFDLPSLMISVGMDQVDLLKLDIERSELVLFSAPTDEWLPRVRNVIIELHDKDCSDAFFSALERYEFELLHRGGNTYCLGLRELSHQK
jgi:FkbM family methyltransferase